MIDLLSVFIGVNGKNNTGPGMVKIRFRYYDFLGWIAPVIFV